MSAQLDMEMNLAEIERLMENEIKLISQPALVETIKHHRVPLRIEKRKWDYADPFIEYPCCILLEDKSSNTAVAYCEKGFGPTHPWGLIFIEGDHMSLGMDSGWFTSLEAAVRESMFWHGPNFED